MLKTAFITDRLKRLYRLSTRNQRVKNAKKKVSGTLIVFRTRKQLMKILIRP
jgi:hypothetical protein